MRRVQRNGAGAHGTGRSLLHTAVPDWWARKASCAIKRRCLITVLNMTDFTAFRRDALRWRQEVETLRQTRHFLRFFTEELYFSAAISIELRLTASLITLGYASPLQPLQSAGHKDLYHPSGVLRPYHAKFSSEFDRWGLLSCTAVKLTIQLFQSSV